MSSSPGRTPQRVPPPRLAAARSHTLPAGGEVSPLARTSAADQAPDNLTIDAQALQERLDDLADQFASIKAQLRQSQKLAALGTTAAMIAHELNNLLTPVLAYCREALDRGDVELMRTALAKTLDRTAAMRQMVDRVVGLARQSDTVIKAVQVRAVVEEAVGCLGRDLGKDNISINIQIDSALACRANENQLLQVLFNLITNARQAMLGRRGRLTVDASARPDGFVEINVRDTGCGIHAQHLADIFDPFFSTKGNTDRPDQRGLGLGLAISKDIIEELGGRIEVGSEVGVGSTFTIMLPLAE
jgi:two-component system NtrC family sensor kinase